MIFEGRFEGKVLLATGGASGLGASVARRYSDEGGKVALLDLNGDKAAAAAAELKDAIGLGVNVADEAAVAAAVETIGQHFGAIDSVFNAAGHAEFGPIEKWTFERFQLMMTVHVGGTFLICKHALPFLMQSSGASIVNVASTAALKANNVNAPYGAAKGAIVAFTRQLARDVAPTIRVNTIAPGRTLTGMTSPLMMERAGSLEKGSEVFGAANLQKRVAGAEEVAAPVCFLLSDEASFMTGSLVVVDGGESA